MKGKFIVFEGIDGSGKTTIIEELSRIIPCIPNQGGFATIEFNKEKINLSGNKIYLPIIKTREPVLGSENTNKIFNHLNSKKNKNNQYLLDCFIKDRYQHCQQIKELLKENNVFCSRYDLSTYAYQSDTKITFDNIYKKHNYGYENGVLIPDLTIYLDTNPNKSIKRIKKRGEEKGFYEKKNKLSIARGNYLKSVFFLRGKDGRKIHIVNSDRDITSVIKQVYNLITN